MEKYQIAIIIALLMISVAVLVVPLLTACISALVKKTSCGTYKKTTVNRTLLFSACLLAAVWCLRYAVGYYSIITAESESLTLNWLEEISNSIVHTFQTFSMDEDYTAYVLDGKQMLGAIFGENTIWKTVYGAYASILNFVAPVTGGAILLEILASAFPKVRLWFSRLAFWKEKYYFSKLNKASAALAKSVCNASGRNKPVIVFADAYSGEESEVGAELLHEAKLIGAICVKEDLCHVRKNRFGKRKFFLIDEAENDNLQTLAELANSSNDRFLMDSEIFLFTNDDAYIQVEQSVRDQLAKIKGRELPTFIPVLSHRNMITNLLSEIPLYEPLIGKKRESDGKQTLTVTILGAGQIGTEMFLSTYWMGQILDCNLKINILSEETEEDFWNKIDYVNPEIRRTTVQGDPILQINRKGDMADIYCQVEYHQCDAKSSQFIGFLTEENSPVLNTDYFLVCLGSDADNISVANKVRKYIGQQHMKANKQLRTVIAYVVFAPELTQMLNRTRFYSCKNGEMDIYMQAIGSLDDVYSVRNVFMTQHELFAQKAHDAYITIQNTEDRLKAHNERLKDDYKYWANLARAMHVKYKVYSMGMMKESLFDHPDAPEVYAQKLAEAYDEFQKVVTGAFEFASLEQEKEHLALLHRMSWLEHRRWNAFTRVKGFRHTKNYDVYAVAGVNGSYKQMDMKLHPCLVECDQKGIRASISAKGVIDTATLFQCEDDTDFDLLDDLSYDLYRKKINDYDFKQYDYPISVF